jgi:hypothetical protein
VIDIDHIPDTSKPEGTNANAKGVTGPHNISDNILNQLLNGGGRQFRMKDADGELYYTGRIITPPMDEQGVRDFAPLDNFGKPNAGATEIWYEIDGTWQEL